ncbi:hypothetical protein Avbf_03463, partial [Armadillidium vulgare]
MPFIDDDLLWCPDNDGSMVDLNCMDPGGGGPLNPANPTHVGISAAGMNDPTLTPIGLGMMGGYNASEVVMNGSQECGDLTELSQADLKGLVGEMPEEDEIFTNINDPVLELDTIFADINNQVDDTLVSTGLVGSDRLIRSCLSGWNYRGGSRSDGVSDSLESRNSSSTSNANYKIKKEIDQYKNV